MIFRYGLRVYTNHRHKHTHWGSLALLCDYLGLAHSPPAPCWPPLIWQSPSRGWRAVWSWHGAELSSSPVEDGSETALAYPAGGESDLWSHLDCRPDISPAVECGGSFCLKSELLHWDNTSGAKHWPTLLWRKERKLNVIFWMKLLSLRIIRQHQKKSLDYETKKTNLHHYKKILLI